MSKKNKLKRFAELKTFPNVFEFLFSERETDFRLKGKWNEEFFRNGNPIALELACGKGDYTIGLAEKYPGRNFIGIDIKGARLWRAAKNALAKNLSNAVFLRTQIEFIEKCFAPGEASEIWITFPDPQKEKPRKRLTHPFFLERYRNILKPGAAIHLKTDSRELHDFTLEVIQENKLTLLDATADLYAEPALGREDAAGIRTFYETGFLAQGKKITYLKFKLS